MNFLFFCFQFPVLLMPVRASESDWMQYKDQNRKTLCSLGGDRHFDPHFTTSTIAEGWGKWKSGTGEWQGFLQSPFITINTSDCLSPALYSREHEIPSDDTIMSYKHSWMQSSQSFTQASAVTLCRLVLPGDRWFGWQALGGKDSARPAVGSANKLWLGLLALKAGGGCRSGWSSSDSAKTAGSY